jgi:hypothetical protein
VRDRTRTGSEPEGEREGENREQLLLLGESEMYKLLREEEREKNDSNRRGLPLIGKHLPLGLTPYQQLTSSSFTSTLVLNPTHKSSATTHNPCGQGYAVTLSFDFCKAIVVSEADFVMSAVICV